ncbi:MAG: 50S ribosomal protein L40e [Candidatus Aenigmatarchaeota archaeon]
MPRKLLPAVMQRLFTNMHVCMNCNSRMRASVKKVREGKIKCRKCGSRDLRLKAKERRGAGV